MRYFIYDDSVGIDEREQIGVLEDDGSTESMDKAVSFTWVMKPEDFLTRYFTQCSNIGASPAEGVDAIYFISDDDDMTYSMMDVFSLFKMMDVLPLDKIVDLIKSMLEKFSRLHREGG